MTEQELKACPWCRATPIAGNDFVECERCNVTMLQDEDNGESESELRERWNTRAERKEDHEQR